MMSGQEMDLDTAIQLFQLVETFDEYAEGLSELLRTCTTDEDVKRAGEVIEEQKQRLMNTNAEFKEIMENRKRESKRRGDYERAIQKAKTSTIISEAKAEAKAKTRATIAKSGLRSYSPDRDIDDWVARTRYKKVDPEELERKSEEELWCPICRQKDTSNNLMNNRPTCFPCMHQLVPKEELKNYPRKYRRAWKRKKKK